MKQNIKQISKLVLVLIFVIFWFPILLVDSSRYEWVNNIAEIARLFAGVIGAFTIFGWINDKYINKD